MHIIPKSFPAEPFARTRGRLRPVALASAIAMAGPALWLATPAVYAQQAASRSYSIPAGPLGPALSAFAGQAGVSLSFASDQTRDLRTAGLQGTHDVAQGFARLLAGTGLAAVPSSGGNYVLRSDPATPAPAPVAGVGTGTATLSEVRVTATSDRGNASTDGTGRYTATGPTGAATGLDLSLRETPQSVSVVTRQRMDDFKLQTLTDVLEQTPGLTVTRQNNLVNFNVRGSSVNLQVDGARQLTTGWGFNTYTMYTMDDLADIDRVEVLKGSSGLMNGDGNYGATVNLIRKRPTREFQAHVEASAGSWDAYRTDADLSGPLNADGSLRGRIVASKREAGSYRDNERSRGSLLFGTVEYDITPHTLLTAGVTYRDRTLRGSGTTTPIQAFSGAGAFLGWMPRSYNNGTPDAGYESEGLNLFARLEHDFGNGWKAKVQAVHEEIKVPDQVIGYIINGVPGTVSYSRYLDNKTRNRSLMVDVQGPFSLFGRQHDLLFGAGTSSGRVTQLRGSAGSTTLGALGLRYAQGGEALPAFDRASLSYSNDLFSRERDYVYTAARFNLTDPLKLIVGARSTNYRQKDVTDVSWYNYDMREKGVVTPYAGLVADVGRDVSVYASYASIFQAQSARDASMQTLPPEQGKTYEVGAKGEFLDKRLNASAAYFWMKTDNTAEAVDQTAAGETIYRAVSGATRRGWELEVSGELAPNWQIQGGYVMNSSNLSSASTTPKHQFKLGTTYRLTGGPLRGLTVGAATRWQSAISTSRNSTLLRQDAYWLVDLMARYEVNRHWSITANLNNAFNKRYFAGVTNFTSQGLFYTWGAPRNFTLSARYTF